MTNPEPTPCWFRGKTAAEPFVRGRIVDAGTNDAKPERLSRSAEARCSVQPEAGGGSRAGAVEMSAADVFLRNPAGHEPDNCRLLHLNEPCVLHNIAARHADAQTYTWTSRLLLATNPFRELESPQDEEQLIARVRGLTVRELPPHVFSVAELAYRGLERKRESQAVIVSGESGSGKTHSMGRVLDYLVQRAASGDGSNTRASERALGRLLLDSNPALEAFGNASTTRNRNSSRFGKFIKVMFDTSCTRLSGITVQTYLLEKIRVVRPAPSERTYHVLHYLVAGASEAQRAMPS